MGRDVRSSTPMPAHAIVALRLSIVCAIVFLVLLAWRHFVKPQLDPSWHVISYYAIGPHQWLMVLAFLALALSCVALAVGIQSHIPSVGGHVGLLLLPVSAAGRSIVAIYATTAPGTWMPSGRLHELSAILDVTPWAVLLITWSLAHHNQAWASARRSLSWTAGLTCVALLSFLVTVAMLPWNDMPWSNASNAAQVGPVGSTAVFVSVRSEGLVGIGWPNRLLVLTCCIWLIVVARKAIRLSTGRTP